MNHPPISNTKSGVITFLALTSGVFICFLVNGVVNEAIFKIPHSENFGWYLTFLQFLFYVLFSGSQLKISGQNGLFLSWNSTLINLAIFNVIAMGLTNASVGYMNYPTQLMFKSCKVISVMAAGILLRGKRYRFVDYVAVIVMTIGLIFFTLADATVLPSFQTKGVTMVVGAVLMDGVVGIYQEDLMQRRGIGQAELIFKMYSLGALLLFAFLWLTGQLVQGSQFCVQNWSTLLPLFLAFATTGYFGVLLILLLIEKFGAFSAVIVTTSRKATTIALSFLIFSKPFTGQYIWSGLLIFLGIYLNAQKTHLQRWLVFMQNAKWRLKLCNLWSRMASETEWVV